MKKEKKIRVAIASALLIGFLAIGPFVRAQASAPLGGTITAINDNTLTIKTDADGVHQVAVPSTASLKRIAPGQKDLSTAETIQFSDLAVGDRATVRLDPNAPTLALRIIAIRQSDLALKQQKDREDWQRRGVGGLVKSVDPAAGVIVLTTGAGATAKTVTIHATKATTLKRYALPSVRFDDAKPAPIDAIHAGDQLQALGNKNADGTELAAEDVISGGFRNIAGTVVSTDVAAATLVVKDLATKKPVTIHVTAEAQMRRLEERMAQMLAMRLKGTASGGAAAAQRGGNSPMGGAGSPGGGQWSGQDGAGADPQQVLSRAPAIQLGDLHKGEAVMLVSTDGTGEATAITLFAGVEPLLEAPAAQNLLSNWSMGSGAGAAEAAAQ
jgi:hypothetical protein